MTVGTTDIECLAAVLVDKVAGMTDDEAAKALGVDRDRLAKAREKNAEAVIVERG